MRVAIIVVTYNAQTWLATSLGSCEKHAPDVPVYVVDNASTDGTADTVLSRYPWVRLLKQSINTGFAYGNNLGIDRALADGAEAVLLLNQDAELTEGALGSLTDFLVTHPDVAAVQPIIMLPNGRVNSAGNSFHFLGFGEAGGNGLLLEQLSFKVPWLKTGQEPPYVSGAAVLLRASALKQVGTFHNELFMYHEDLELSLRLRVSGWKLAVRPDARVIHHYEHSRSLRQYYYMERNRLVVWCEVLSLRTLLILLPAFLVSELALLIVAAGKGWLLMKLRAYAYFFRLATWRQIKHRRKDLRVLRRMTDAELMSYASARIEYQPEETGAATRYVLNPLSTCLWRLLKPLV
jgi:GT2 family glycosyltransferase